MAGTSSSYEIEATAQALGNLLGLVFGWLYYTLFESSKYQATLGKNAWVACCGFEWKAHRLWQG